MCDAVIASFMLAESLKCNKCNYGVGGFCLSNTDLTCTTNTSVCFTGKATFPSVSTSFGFNTQGCREPAGCNVTIDAANQTILGIAYVTKIDCCGTDKCNPVQVSGAPSARMTFTATVGAAVLASVWGSML